MRAKTVTLLGPEMRRNEGEEGKDGPDNLSQTGAEGSVLWSEDLPHHCVWHRSNSHSISNCRHHQRHYQAHLLSFTITREVG